MPRPKKNEEKPRKVGYKNPPKGKTFSSDYQPNNNGRPRKFVSTLAAQGYKKSEVRDAMLVLISMNEAELVEIKKNPESTALEKIVAGALIKDMQKSTTWALEAVLDRNIGLTMDDEDKQQILKVVVENRSSENR